MKIAFIAMSGVRAASEELNRIGMTLPGFVERSQCRSGWTTPFRGDVGC